MLLPAIAHLMYNTTIIIIINDYLCNLAVSISAHLEDQENSWKYLCYGPKKKKKKKKKMKI